MSNPSSLLEQATLFEKLAQTPASNPQTQQLSQQINAQKNLILQEITDGIKMINMLVTTSRAAAQSEGLQHLDDLFSSLANEVKAVTADTGAETIMGIRQKIDGAAFYTQKGNQGIGFDPATRLGGARSPGTIVDKISGHIQTLQSLLSRKPKTTAPPPRVI